MNTDSQASIPEERLKKLLEEEIWQQADMIGRPDCWYRITDYNDDQMAGYAHGVSTALGRVAEGLGLGVLETRQLDAALGERLHRRGSVDAKLKTRRFNNLIVQIRSARVALIDDYQPLDYEAFQHPVQRKIWRLEREGCATDAETFDLQVVQKEFRALVDLHYHLTSDHEWYVRKVARQEKAQVAA